VKIRVHRAKRAFTLIELMLVVALVGILAVLAVYGVRRYAANSKTAEARNALHLIVNAAVARYDEERMEKVVFDQGTSRTLNKSLCKDSSVSVPATPPKATKYQSSKADWSNSADAAADKGFPCLKFEMTAPQYYSYSYGGVGANGNGQSFTALARGDLNGDAVYSSFWIVGTVTNSRVSVMPTIAELSPDE
jgi:type IV pilus assembly protein PilA